MQETKLQSYFPMLKTRRELLEIIRQNENLSRTFYSWPQKRQEEFLDFCSGARGVKMLYDAFAKELLSPTRYPERLNEILSLLLGTEATIIDVLPTEGIRLAAEQSLLTMDMVVKLADGTICNVEVQKIGYAFPGQRSACYSADLLLRQYKAVRAATVTEAKFSYREVKNVYSIIFFEHSPKEFHGVPDHFIHRYQQQGDTGVELELLQKYIFITLDNFLGVMQNKDISNRLNAWLLFFGSDDPEDIIRLIETYPDFGAMYRQIYEICENVENVMGVFSEELKILDRNTVRYMMDEMQEEIDQKKAELEQMNTELSQMNTELSQMNTELSQMNTELSQMSTELDQKTIELDQKNAELDQKTFELDQKTIELDQKKSELDQQRLLLTEKDTLIAAKDSVIAQKDAIMVAMEEELKKLRQLVSSKHC